MSTEANISLFVFCLDDLFTDVSGVLKSAPIIVLLPVPPFKSVDICFYVFRCAYAACILIDPTVIM